MLQLDNIIKKVATSNSIYDEDYERLVILDTKTGETFYEKDMSLMAKSIFGRKYNYYVINFNEFTKVNNLKCEISDPKAGLTIKLSISFELSIRKGREVNAVRFLESNLTPQKTLEKAFANWVRKFTEEHPNFTNDFYNLDEKIRPHLEERAKRKGVNIKITNLTPDTVINSNVGPSHITLVHTSHCEIINDHIDVKNKIVLNLFNKRALAWRNIKNPEEWIKQQINTIIQNELISKSFKDIIDGFETDLKERIASKIEAQVKSIGYNVQQIISVPSEEIEKFLDGFEFNLKDNSLFITQGGKIKVKLNAVIKGKGSTLRGIDQKYIKPRKSIIDEIKKLVVSIISDELRKTKPDDYYMRFYETIHETLNKVITIKLNDLFKIRPRDLSITIETLDTDLNKRLELLQSERGEIHIATKSENTYYSINFGIQGVNDWFNFHKNHIKYHGKPIEEFNDLSNYIKDYMELEILRFTKDYIETQTAQALDSGIENLFKSAQTMVNEEFGLFLGKPRLRRVSKADIGIDSNSALLSGFKKRKEKIFKRLEAAAAVNQTEEIMELTNELNKVDNEIKKIETVNNKFNNLGQGNNIKKIDNSNEQ